MTTLRYNLVDVFTDMPLTGNSLAVFTSGVGLSTETMQSVARAMNLSETVFLLPSTGEAHAKVRIFTPKTELPFAGHPVLGSAWILGGPIAARLLRLETLSGIVDVELERGGDRLISAFMQQPVPESLSLEAGLVQKVHSALGLGENYAPELPTAMYQNGPQHLLVHVPDVLTLSSLDPNFYALGRATQSGVLVYAFDTQGLDPRATDVVRARYFAPAMGVFEDPATGSAAGPLAVHLASQQKLAFGRQLIVRQGIEMMRPSLLLAEVHGALSLVTAVRVGGAAVVVGRGELKIR